MRFDVITLFPEMIEALSSGVIGRARDRGLISWHSWNPRDYTQDVHRTVDDRPYGGGPGMVMQIAPLEAALQMAVNSNPVARTVYLSPQGEPLNQSMVRDFASEPGMILLCGRYEGIDERLLQKHVDIEVSVGDFVVSGGELPAMALMDAVARCLPGVLGHEDSAEQDSFENGLLDCPHYTRPEVYNGEPVPEVLLSGNHAAIERWRLQQSLVRTRARRPDLFRQRALTKQEQDLIDQYDAQTVASKTRSNNHE